MFRRDDEEGDGQGVEVNPMSEDTDSKLQYAFIARLLEAETSDDILTCVLQVLVLLLVALLAVYC